MTEFRAGWVVVGNDGRRLGVVKDVGRHYIVTSRFGFAADLYVPALYIANVEHETIHLSLTHDAAEQMGWEEPPRDDDPANDPDSELHRHI
jgi:hypothetical protein